MRKYELDKKEHNKKEHGYKNDKDRRRRLLREGNAVGCWAGDTDGAAKVAWYRPHRLVLWVGDNTQDLPLVTQPNSGHLFDPTGLRAP